MELPRADDLRKMAGFCLAFCNLQPFERQLADFHLLPQFGDSLRKPVPCRPLKLHPVFLLRYQLLLSGKYRT